MSLEDKVRAILAGIDSCELQNNYGWWETSTGAEFGRKKLEEVLQAIREAEQQKATDQRPYGEIVAGMTSDKPYMP